MFLMGRISFILYLKFVVYLEISENKWNFNQFDWCIMNEHTRLVNTP